MKIKDLKMVIDSESLNIYIDKGEDNEPVHVVYWTEDEWLEDAQSVVGAMLKAIELYNSGQHKLLLETIGLGNLISNGVAELIPSDEKIVGELEAEQYAHIKASNINMIIKHNDVGISVDYYGSLEQEPVRADQVWFEDIPRGTHLCNNCGGGFNADEITTDEDGDDYCEDCK